MPFINNACDDESSIIRIEPTWKPQFCRESVEHYYHFEYDRTLFENEKESQLYKLFLKELNEKLDEQYKLIQFTMLEFYVKLIPLAIPTIGIIYLLTIPIGRKKFLQANQEMQRNLATFVNTHSTRLPVSLTLEWKVVTEIMPGLVSQREYPGARKPSLLIHPKNKVLK